VSCEAERDLFFFYLLGTIDLIEWVEINILGNS